MRLLIVEDEKNLCDTIAKNLYGAGYEVDTSYDGNNALDCILSEDYDLIVLDLNLPGTDGMDILKELRKKNEETKVIILSAKSQIADKVAGLDAGANDYLEKPFHLQELEARIRSLTRRKFVQKDVCLHCGEIKFDTKKREAYANDKPVSLTRKENGILEYPVAQLQAARHGGDGDDEGGTALFEGDRRYAVRLGERRGRVGEEDGRLYRRQRGQFRLAAADHPRGCGKAPV